jgi:beta-glucosidase
LQTVELIMSHVDEILKQMTLEEKISMLAGADLWHSVAIPRLGVPQFKVTDGPNGARGAWGSMASPSVATPVGIALGATCAHRQHSSHAHRRTKL